VDDDPAVRQVVTAGLEQDQLEVRAAEDIEASRQLLQSQPFDVILTDLFVRAFSPGGFTPLDAYREVAPDVPIMVLTAHTQATHLDPTHFGLAAIIAKPVVLADLVAQVRAVLASRDRHPTAG
jgi:DNA-binding NtrC family response regulator